MTTESSASVGNTTAARGMLDHPLAQLALVRVREFVREPEAVFWTLVFPILLTAALGIAFRGGSAEVLKIASTSAGLADALRREPSLDVALMPDAEAHAALHSGRYVPEKDERVGIILCGSNTGAVQFPSAAQA